MEQTSDVYSNIRSTGKYQSLTRQATKGKAKEGGQSIGNLDVNALITCNVPSLLSELLTLRSDDHNSKRQVINNIISTGSSKIPTDVGGGATQDLLKTFITGMGLDMS